MTKLSVNLPEEIVTQAEEKAAAAGFASVDQYICSLIESDKIVPLGSELEDELIRGLDSGASVSLTPAILQEIKQRARRHSAS